jgi:hypothetical protein
MRAKVSSAVVAATITAAIIAGGSATAKELPEDEIVDSRDDIVKVDSGETVELDDGTIISAPKQTGVSAMAAGDCPNGNGCIYRNAGFGTLILQINPGSAAATPWAPHSDARSAKNRYSDRRLVLATHFNGAGEPQNRICIPAGGQSGQFNPFNPPRYYSKAGAKNQDANC